MLKGICDLIFLLFSQILISNSRCSNGDIDRALSPHLVKGANQRKASPLQQQSAKNGCTAIMGDPEMSTSKPNQVILADFREYSR